MIQSKISKVVLLCVLFLVSNTLFAQLWMVDPLEAIYPDKNDVETQYKSWTLHNAIGMDAEVHVLLKLPIQSHFSMAVTLDGNDVSSEVLSKLIAVPVEQNTGVDSRTEQYLGKKNPDVIRRAPFDIFEVIEPVTASEFVSESVYSAYKITIPRSKLEKKGAYKVHVSIKGNDISYAGNFHIKVYDVELPLAKDSKFFYTNWFNLSKMESQYKLERWSDNWFAMLHKYAALMAHGRQNSISIPGELITYKNGTFKLDEDKMLRFIDVFRAHGFKYFESAHIMNRGDNDDWGDAELKVALTKNRYYTEHGKEDVAQLITLIKNFTTRNNLTNNWLQHISDEPTAVNAACYKDVAKQLKTVFPEIRIMDATNARESLAGAIDIWCPIINDFQENETFFRGRESKGEQVLVYTCLIPGGKWLNRTLDQEKLRQVYFGWGAAHYNTGGYLHWGLNQYFADPYKQSVVKHHAPGAAANNFLPAGDTHIVYPGAQGPLSSIRFESHRLGIEDYDLLQLLKQKNKQKYNQIIAELFRTYTDYNIDVKAYRKAKKQLLKALK